MTTRNVAPPRRRPKRVLVVRMLVAKLAWLEGRPYWRDGRVVWEGSGGKLAPEAADLARAQRVMTRLKSYPFASREALGDSEAWLRERRARLEQAKQLRAVAAPDLPSLVRQAQSGQAPAVERLAALLVAEALCINALPLAPSAALLACGARAEAPLRTLIDDEAAPVEGRALAALTLGALHRAGLSPRSSLPALAGPYQRRAYRWGLNAGLAGEPRVMVALLADEVGPELAGRATRALDARASFRLPTDLLRELLASGTPPARVVALAEAVQSAEPLAERMLQRRRELPDRASPQRRSIAEQLAVQGRRAVDDLGALLEAYGRATADPVVVRGVSAFAGAMLDLGRLTPELAEAILRPLRRGLELPTELLRAYVELLVERQDALWDRSTLPTGKKAGNENRRLAAWLEERWSHEARPMLELLLATHDPEIVREALDRRVHGSLSRYRWDDLGFYRLVLTLSRDVCPPGEVGLIWSLCWIVPTFPDAATARSLLQPLFQAVTGAPRQTGEHVLESLLDHLPDTRQGVRDALPRVVRYLPRLLRFAGTHEAAGCVCGGAVRAALHLDQAVPDRAEIWLDWLLSHLTALARQGGRPLEGTSVRMGVALALRLAEGDFGRFQVLFRAAAQHCFHQDQKQLEQSLPLLDRFPALRAPLAQLFPRQPQRCADLLVRLGLTTQLGPEALTPLTELERGATAAPPGSDWAALLHLCPELEGPAAAYRRARELLGGSPSVPPGCLRAMELPERLAREREYLERRLEQEPHRAELSARVRSLCARLADREALLGAIREELRERLEQVAAEAQIAAAEQQVLACYRERLAAVVGPLPADTRFDDDLLNATLLTVDIIRNRRLLLRLLRAHLAGERNWREQHPANAAFLQSLAAAGIDAEAWLAAHPRRYPCPGAGGGWVHLRLERDPIRILQMGNYFDTCLSFGGCNSFATVTNACELNKRVVYATDGAGRVVGRKLIAINAEGGLVGFHTYSSLPDDESNRALRAICRHYLTGFAERCRLPLANGGAVRTLFAQEWYDDGAVAWNDEEEAPPGVSGASRRRRAAK